MSIATDWLPRLCLYCLQATEGAPVCPGCAAALPWNRSACPGCAEPLPAVTLCRACQKRPQDFDSAWTAFTLAAPVHQSVLGLKYASRFEQARLLGRLMAQKLAQRAEPLPDLLIPVPLHRGRLFRRGYNQALELARGIAEVLAIEVDARSARRLRATEDQIGKSRAQRRRNLRKAFAIGRSLDGLHVALLDDVLTTGSTLSELARICRAAGAVRIEAWAAARTR